MDLCDVVSSYIHYVGLIDYVMKVLPSLDEVVFTCYVDV